MLPIRISVVLFTVALCASAQDSASLARHAVELQQSGQYEEAASTYADLLKLIPDDVATHVNYGVVLVNLRRYEEAISQYQAAEKLLPGDPRIELNLALAYEKSGRGKDARALFEKLHTAEPEKAQVTMLLGDSYLQSQEYGRVITTLQPLKDSDDLAVAYMLGTALLRTHHPDEAHVYLHRILKNGDTAEARFLQGMRAYEAKDYPEAAKQLAAAAELNPNLPHLESLLGTSLLYTGDPDGALKAFDLALSADPDDVAATLDKAQILTMRKQHEAALPLAKRALELQPDNPEAKLALAEALLACKMPQQASPLAEQAVQAMPESEHAYRILASIHRAERLVTQAEAEERTADELAEEHDPGPKVGKPAPDFALADAATGKAVRLSDFQGRSPVMVIFGSYTCPNFRGSADALKSMQQRYGARIPFLLVYIREAHAEGQWQSTRNTREDVSLSPAATMAEKADHATMCSRKLHLPFPALVDSMDGAVEAAYNAWPSRAYIIGRDGRIVYSTRLSELDFDRERTDTVLRRLAKP